MREVLKLPLLSGGAIWAVAAASGALNAWGWSETATGLVAALLVVLSLACEVLGVRLASVVEAQGRGTRQWVGLALLAGVVAFNAYSGHRALERVEQDRGEPRRLYLVQAGRLDAEVARLEAEVAAVPPLPRNVPAVRVRAYREVRDAELTRLRPLVEAARARRDGLVEVAAPPEGIPDGGRWAIVLLAEALKALGLWAIGAGHAARAGVNPGAALAARRWGLKAA
jgi:hypothetical protein